MAKTNYRITETESTRRFFNLVGAWFYTFFFVIAGYRLSIRHFIRCNIDLFNLHDDTRILDSGIGTGFLTESFLRTSELPRTITGLDFSEGMMAGLRKRLHQTGLAKRVALNMADMRKMPFPEACFDLVMTSAAIEYLPRVEDGFSEFARVLKPGGQMLVITTRDSLMGEFIAATWRNNVYDPQYIRECMAAVGMTNIRELTFPRYFPHVNWWGMILLGEKIKV